MRPRVILCLIVLTACAEPAATRLVGPARATDGIGSDVDGRGPSPGDAPAGDGIPDGETSAPETPVDMSRGPDRSKPPWSQTPTPPIDVGQVVKDIVAGGRHWRIGTENGVVHVWRPPGYQGATAGIVLYLHGYYTNVDQAWEDHRLAEQFRDSGQNALFIVPEAPSWRGEDVFWKDLGELLRRVSRVTRLRTPDGTVVVVGHSGAYRTVLSWLGYSRLDMLIMLDAMYGSTDEYVAWLQQGPRHRAKRLLMVGAETEGRSRELLRRFPRSVRRKDIPRSFAAFPAWQRQARVLYMRSDRYDHMEIVTRGEVIPLVLRLAPLGRLSRPRAADGRPAEPPGDHAGPGGRMDGPAFGRGPAPPAQAAPPDGASLPAPSPDRTQ